MLDLFRALSGPASAGQQWMLTFHWPHGAAARAALVVLFVAAAAAGVWSAWSLGRHKGWVLGLRLAALGLLGLLVLRPTLDFVETERVRNVLAVLLDESLSMSARSGTGDATRADLVRQFLGQTRSEWERPGPGIDLKAVGFGRGVRPASLEAASKSYRAGDDASWLLPALEQIKEPSRDGTADAPLCGVVLISDGAVADRALDRDEMRERAIGLAKELGVPFLCVTAGDMAAFKDIGVRVLKQDAFAFVRNPWRIEVGVRAVGYGSVRLPVTLKQGGDLISTQVVQLPADGQERRLAMQFSPRWPGQIAFTVSAPVQADECFLDNNVARVGVQVIRDKTRVLHVCGRPSWDVRFLRRFLKQTPNVDLIAFFILRTLGESMNVSQKDLSLIAFPTDELFTRELHSFDVVVLQNFDYRPYDIGRLRFQQYLENLRKYVVEDGGALVMVGGDLSFAHGGYAKSPLADILPVRMDPHGDTLHRGEVDLALTRVGRVHPITQLSSVAKENVAIWAGLPALQGCNITSGLRPNASCLAVHQKLSRNGEPVPVIAVNEAGAGRVLAVMADTTWHWNFVGVGKGRTNRHYLKFWRNAIRWLTRSPDLQHVRVRTPGGRARPGDTANVSVRAFDREYQPEADRPLEIAATRQDQAKPEFAKQVTTDGSGVAEVKLPLRGPGVYEIRARDPALAPDVGQQKTASGLYEDVAQIICDYSPEELARPEPDEPFMQKLAAATGGWAVTLPSQNMGLSRFKPKVTERVLGRRSYRLWDNFICLGLALGLLGSEWWLRRRSA